MKKSCKLFIIFILLISFAVPACAKTSPFCTLDPNIFDSPSFILMEAKTGTIIMEKDADKRMPMASITKLTVLLIADDYIAKGKISLNDIVTGTAEAKATEGSRIYLDEGEKMTVDQIMKSISLPSANDAAVAFADFISGNEKDFVKLMNKKADELGLKNTHYVTVSGLDADGHYSTARDIATISREIVLHHPRLMQHAGTRTDSIRNGTFPLQNTNKLLSRYQYATGLKTGTTDNAGYCLAATAKKNGVDLIAVILGAKTADSRFTEAKYLFEYAYKTFSLMNIRKKGALTDEKGKHIYANVIRGNLDKVPLNLKNDLTVYVPSGKANSLKVDISIDKKIKAPIPKGTAVGEVTVHSGSVLVGSEKAVTAQEVKKMNIFQAFFKVIKSWLSF
ncbi:MAG: D-alanyl-D-alanine carboxypeptidase family protein [Bacillota bacterium]|nr:D-alanyl-D-alanine carboxypeptidase family protein [Bacillota bacterium]